jgi:hypothetical protein
VAVALGVPILHAGTDPAGATGAFPCRTGTPWDSPRPTAVPVPIPAPKGRIPRHDPVERVTTHAKADPAGGHQSYQPFGVPAPTNPATIDRPTAATDAPHVIADTGTPTPDTIADTGAPTTSGSATGKPGDDRDRRHGRHWPRRGKCTPTGTATPTGTPTATATATATVTATATGTGTGTGEPTGTAAAGPTAATGTAGRPATTGTGGPTARAAAPISPAATSAKEGVGVGKSAGMADALEASGASWFYTWGPDSRGLRVPGVDFVPMIRDDASIDTAVATAKASGSDTLLGFDEPDRAAMTVEQAVARWPKLEATGLRLGAPAVATGADTDGGWLERFMAGATAKGYRVDFIPLHWSGADVTGDATEQLRSYLEKVHEKYGKPIWVTEYALTRWQNGTAGYPTPATRTAFATSSTALLEGLPYVERYAG